MAGLLLEDDPEMASIPQFLAQLEREIGPFTYTWGHKPDPNNPKDYIRMPDGSTMFYYWIEIPGPTMVKLARAALGRPSK